MVSFEKVNVFHMNKYPTVDLFYKLNCMFFCLIAVYFIILLNFLLVTSYSIT